jgi:hypothetical protein
MGLFPVRTTKLLSLNRRIVAGRAVGNTIVQSEQMTLAQFGGLNFTGGKYVNPDSTNRWGEALMVGWEF